VQQKHKLPVSPSTPFFKNYQHDEPENWKPPTIIFENPQGRYQPNLPCTNNIPDDQGDLFIDEQLKFLAAFEECAARFKSRVDTKAKSYAEEAEAYMSSLKTRRVILEALEARQDAATLGAEYVKGSTLGYWMDFWVTVGNMMGKGTVTG
jgi:hypothetical protein